jgi:hypothetical protein
VSKFNWFIQERKEPRKKEYCRIFFKKRKELSGENITKYLSIKERYVMWKIFYIFYYV